MGFNVTSSKVKPGIVRMALSGELDAGTAAEFRAEIERNVSPDLSRLVLDVSELEYMASAGIRVMVFARQKMGAGVEIFVVCPQEAVLEVLEMTGMKHALTILEQDDPARIEGA